MRLRLACVVLVLCVAGCEATTPVPPVAEVSISLASIDVGVGGSHQLEATVVDAEGRVHTDRAITWTAGAEGILTVSPSGLVSATSLGVTRVTAAVDGIMDTVLVRVPATQEAMDEQVAYWIERTFGYELYNNLVIKTPIGTKNINASCPNGGSVAISGSTSQSGGANQVGLAYSTNECRVHTTIGELRSNGPVSVSGSWSYVDATDNLTYAASVAVTISGMARLADGTPFSVHQSCLFSFTRTTSANGDASTLSGTMCGRPFTR